MALSTASRFDIGIAVVLAFVAGAVDAIGFTRLGALFVSFMSGNSTQLGVALAHGDLGTAVRAAGLVGSFVIGAGVGSGIGRKAGRWQRQSLLTVEAALLAAAAWTLNSTIDVLGPCLLAAAMGLENAIFANQDGESTIGLTFVTGRLVKLATSLATAMLGGDRWGWCRHLFLWLGLVAGAIVGAVSYAALGTGTLYTISGMLLVMAALFQWSGGRIEPGSA